MFIWIFTKKSSSMTLVSTPGKFLHAHSRQWKTRNRKRLSLHLEEGYKCPQKNVKPRKHVSLSIVTASGGCSPPKPSKLCGNICKALRGNNGPYLTTDRRSLEKVGYARMADSSTHRQSHFLYMPMLLKPLCARTLKNQGQISRLVWGQKKNLQHVQTATF